MAIVYLNDRPDIVGVKVDDKRVINPVAFNLEEGWVDIQVPILPRVDFEDTDFEDKDEDLIDMKWETKRITGKLQLLLKKLST